MMPFLAPLKGKHALTSYWHNRMAKGSVIEDVSVIILDIWSSEKFVYERGSYQITYKKYQNNIKAVHGSYFTVWEKQNDGSLKIKYDIANLDHRI
jgi:ketosteroid isomerase-like protein